MQVLTTSKPDQCPWQHVGFGWVRHSLAENFDGLYGLSLAATLNMDFDEIMVTSNNCSRWFIMNPATSQIWSKDLAGKGNVCPGWGRCRLGDMLRLLSGQTIRWFIWVRKTTHQWGTCDFVESVFDTSCEPQPECKVEHWLARVPRVFDSKTVKGFGIHGIRCQSDERAAASTSSRRSGASVTIENFILVYLKRWVKKIMWLNVSRSPFRTLCNYSLLVACLTHLCNLQDSRPQRASQVGNQQAFCFK